MKSIILILVLIFVFLGCSREPTIVYKNVIVEKACQHTVLEKVKIENKVIEAKRLFKSLPKTYLLQHSFNDLPNWHNEDYADALNNFVNSCQTKRTRKIYKDICKKAKDSENARYFIEHEFLPYKINTNKGKEEGLLTGYYEPELSGSLKKTKKYKYPIYETPEDLIMVDLSSIYPHLKNYRLRGKIDGNKLVPYHTRKQSSSKHIPAKIICYTDSKIDLFFLEIQGSGRVKLENGKVLYIGYGNQNGHRYRAIGKYLVKIGALKLKEVSLQSIRAWLDKNPRRVDEVLNYNKSVVYFKQREKAASGSLGVCLTASRSIAVDRRYIPLGSILYLNANIEEERVSKIVLAQDTGGAIKGAIRADMFLGCGREAREVAGKLKSSLELWILLPKNKRVDI